MNGLGNVFYSVFDIISEFGTAYFEALSVIFTSLFAKPVRFLKKFIKRTLRLILRGVVYFFAPSSDSKKYVDDVIRALKKCGKTLVTHPGSLPSVLKYYIKKSIGRYAFGVKNICLWLIPSLFIAVFIIGCVKVGEYVPALKIEANGEVIGYSDTEERFFDAKSKARTVLAVSDSEVEFPELEYSFAFVNRNSLSDADALCDRLLEKTQTDMVSACGIYVDGKNVGVVYSENEARAFFNGLLASEKADSSNYSVSFSQTVEYKTGLYPEKAVQTTSQFAASFLVGEKEEFIYSVKSGDTLESIAAEYNMTAERIRQLNENTDFSTALVGGEKITLEQSVYPLTLKVVKSEVMAKPIQYETLEIESNSLYSGSTRVLSAGKNGYAQVTNLVTYIDDVAVSSNEVSRFTLSEPVPERIQVGTKPLDEAYSNPNGDALFIWPIIGAYGINSDYGYRWGKLHGGIDLGMGNAAGTSLGKTVVAVSPGTVITASVHSSYGYYVIIDHGSGMQTLYAHCLANSLMVVPGQTVVAGQPIARVGSTGYSTGPHLHFEVRINGNRVDPKPYLGIKY